MTSSEGTRGSAAKRPAGGTFSLGLSRGGVYLLWLVCLLPLILFAAFAARQHREQLTEVEHNVGRTIQILEEHALRVFEAQELIIDRTDQYLGAMNWDDVRTSVAVHRFLRSAAAASPHVDGLWLVPPDGRTANSADFFPFPGVDVSDRGYFQALSERDELHYGEMIVGRTKGTLNFNVSRRRSPRDSFNGLILVTSSLGYFTDFWQQASMEKRFVAGLFREDGQILARYPAADGRTERLDDDSPLLRAMRERDDDVYRSRSTIDERERIYGFSRIGDTPLILGYGVDTQDALAAWNRETLRMGLVAALASALLVLAAATILRQTRRLSSTAVSWRETAEELHREVDRRLLAEDVAEERERLLRELNAVTVQRQTILRNMVEGVLSLDREGRIVYANPEAETMLGLEDPAGTVFAQLVADGRLRAADDTLLAPSEGPHAAPLAGEALSETEYVVHTSEDGQAVCCFRGAPVIGTDGQVDGAVLTFWDVTERKQESERKELLMRELDHRVRNMLATIVAMIRISDGSSKTKEEFSRTLTGRVRAMARAHGVLSEGKWEGATIGRLVEYELESAGPPNQLSVEGNPDIMLPPKEAADLALALHELGTNATKYGAWSVPGGRVHVSWTLQGSGEARRVVVDWKETGGPRIDTPPQNEGFGSILLKGIMDPGEEGVVIDYEPDGLRCRMKLPVAAAGGSAAPRAEHAEPADEQSDPAPLQGLRLLVVEDEAVVRLDLAEMLRGAGAATVTEAPSLPQGMDAVRTGAFDAAVLDMNLNGKSSLPIAQELARRGVPLVFVTGYQAADRGCAELPRAAYLQKPVSEQRLMQALRAAADR